MLSVDAGVLRHETTLRVLGVPTRFATNDPAMLAIVDEAFGLWRALTSHEVLDADDGHVAQVRISLIDDAAGDVVADASAAITHELSGDLRFVARWGSSVAESDPSRRSWKRWRR